MSETQGFQTPQRPLRHRTGLLLGLVAVILILLIVFHLIFGPKKAQRGAAPEVAKVAAAVRGDMLAAAQETQLADQQTQLTVQQSRLIDAVSLIGDLGGGWSQDQLHSPGWDIRP